METRFALREDVALILDFVRQLARYEHLEDQVTADPAVMEKWLFDERRAEVLFALCDGKEVGFALFFHNYSTFLGKCVLYLEDLFVLPEYRGRGFGKGLLRELARITMNRGCGRLEWCCLDWNRPSIDFYKKQGAPHGRVDDVPAHRRRAGSSGKISFPARRLAFDAEFCIIAISEGFLRKE